MPATLPITDREDVKKMLAYLRARSPRDALLFQTGVNTILRIGDLLKLTVKHVAKSDGTIRKYIDIKEQKTSKYNRIVITSTLAPVLKKYISNYNLDPDDYLFYRYWKCKDFNIPITRDWSSKILCAAAEACGIENFNTHSMRKTHAYHIYKTTHHDIALVSSLLNHANPAVTFRYLGITQEVADKAREIIAF
ncbi:MAG: tyrosine-type recombinase/integrase [Candidatus Neomarinimicrobiota bacterium]